MRRWLFTRLDPHIERTYRTNVLSGFAGWFTFDRATEPQRWKQAFVVLLALLPISLAITYLRTLVWLDAPLVPAVLAAGVIGVALVTWVAMPLLTCKLSGWFGR
jgi:antibiotic biosynthesis monooxygenase (ABM) superfamily enzyme